jgi:hypothetical protein
MSKLTLLVVGMALATCANTHAQSAASLETELQRLVGECNGAADSSKRKFMRACETLENEGRLSLVEPAAVTAYRRYQEERLQACLRRQASPRGPSRGQPDCER